MYINNTVKFFILCLAVLNCSSAKNDITEPQEAPQETKISYRDEMRLNISKNAGNTILVTDYCEKDTKVDNAINLNAQNGFLPFSADDRNLTTIPTYPEKPFLANADDINTLKAAKNHIFLLNYAKFESKEELFESLSQTDYDVLIIDAILISFLTQVLMVFTWILLMLLR